MPDKDIVIVPAGAAWPAYLKYYVYLCPWDRTFSPPHLQRMGFYSNKEIHQHFPKILERVDDVMVDAKTGESLSQSNSANIVTLGKAIVGMIAAHEPWVNGRHQAFILSTPESLDTFTLTEPVVHRSKGAWARNRRYLSSEVIERRPRTTDDLV